MPESRDPKPPVPAPVVSPAARERAAQLLAQRYATDDLSQSDLERRLELVYAAATPAELEAVTADLAVATRGPATPNITALASGQERRMTGAVPPAVRVRARLGYVELDLRDATFAPGVTEIDVRALLGYVQVRLPADVRVEGDGHAFLGYFAAGDGKTAASIVAASTVRIVGRAVLGFVEVTAGKRLLRAPK